MNLSLEKSSSTSMNRPKILVINPCDWFNKGDVTNRLGLVYALKKEFGPEISITIESATPEQDSNYFNKYGVKVIKGLFVKGESENVILKHVKSSLSFVLIFLTTVASKNSKNILLLMLHVLNPALRQTFLEYYASDFIISAPGGFLSDNYVFSSLAPNLLQIFLVKFLNKPVIIYGQSVGPFKSKFLARLTGLILNTVDMILLRERRSKFWLEKMLVKKPLIYITGDSTFSVDFKISCPRFASEKTNLSVGMTLAAGWVSDGKKRKVYSRYLVSVANFIDHVIEQFKADVYILPQVVDQKDFEAAKSVRELVKNKSKLFIDSSDYTPEYLMMRISQMDLFVGTRMHSNIFALIMNVPVIAIAYEHKTYGIMELLGLENWVLNIESFNEDELYAKVVELYNKRFEIKMIMLKKVEEMRNRSLYNAEIIKDWYYQTQKER